MSMIVFDGERFVYGDDDGRQRVLLNVREIYGNHSAVSMMQNKDASYGMTRNEKPFINALLEYLEPFKAKGQLGSIHVLLMLIRELLKKPRAIKVLRVGGRLEDAFNLAAADILKAFHADNLLCSISEGAGTPDAENILHVPLEMKGLQMGCRQAEAVFFDDMGGGISSDMIGRLLPVLRPSGCVFCLTSRGELMDACQKLMPGAERLRAERNLWLLVHELSYSEWEHVWSLTPEGKLAREKVEIVKNMNLLRMDMEVLEFLDGIKVSRLMKTAKDLEISIKDIYIYMASIDAKLLVTQFREVLMDWQLGIAEPKRVRACFEALREELFKYGDISGELGSLNFLS
ncbi:hypothetical protein [Selenomonas sp. KH1T6]|uniref:hypothetical protein n=1 Tax=Selenomonas sp. KH1T6 TaxID=3158784 RepID=UPI0008A7AC58|nr:hypothetical protein SAMN05216583_1471 [Selenomonas ruminantium]